MVDPEFKVKDVNYTAGDGEYRANLPEFSDSESLFYGAAVSQCTDFEYELKVLALT